MPQTVQKKKPQRRKKAANNTSIRQELKQDIIGIIMLAFGAFVAVCLWQVPSEGGGNLLGTMGTWVYQLSLVTFGSGKWFLVIALLLLGCSRWFGGLSFNSIIIGAYIMLVLAGCSVLHLLLPLADQTLKVGLAGKGGGLLGGALVQASNFLIGNTGSWIFYVALTLVSLLIITNRTITEVLRGAFHATKGIAQNAHEDYQQFVVRRQERRQELSGKQDKSIMQSLQVPIETELREDKGRSLLRSKSDNNIGSPGTGEKIVKADADDQQAADLKGSLAADFAAAKTESAHTNSKDPADYDPKAAALAATENNAAKENNNEGFADLSQMIQAAAGGKEYALPPLSLLKSAPRIKSNRLNKDITDNVQILEETLNSFGVKAVVTQVNRGPSITRYELQPSPGVKVSKIVNLADDIALALAAAHVRIEAPIPGKAAVGIEVPNSEITTVSLKEILEDPSFQNATSKLTFALGKDIAGKPIVADLAKMPHLLIAGSTGSGKSVCMNALIASILFNTHPDEVKLMMIDPKMVELSNYNGIPHLIHPVVTEAKKAATALRWAVHEMEKRYELFAEAGVKDIFRYNQAMLEKESENRPPLLPQILILIDELADLMMVAPADVEDAICRLAQMARAAGMHLVVATQRPSVDVITGIIKANIPSRIAFAVSSQVDSRTILDMGGAERLLGRGDMLFYPTGLPKPIRVQGVYVSDQEIEALTEYLKTIAEKPKYIEELVIEKDAEAQEEAEIFDSLLPEAARLFIESGQASISLLQRRLRIGYTRAARIIDQMEEQGIVGGYEGSKARSIRMTMQQYEERFGSSTAAAANSGNGHQDE